MQLRNRNIIETTRLILRPPHQGDAQPLNEAIHRSLSELSRWEAWAMAPSLATTIAFIDRGINEWGNEEKKEMPFIIVHKADNKIIGATGYNERSDPSVPYYEIGYWIDSTYTKQGLATEAAIALTQYAFKQLNAVRVQICCQSKNKASARVAEKCGYTLEAKLRYQYKNISTGLLDDRLVFACFGLEKYEAP